MSPPGETRVGPSDSGRALLTAEALPHSFQVERLKKRGISGWPAGVPDALVRQAANAVSAEIARMLDAPAPDAVGGARVLSIEPRG
jgi:hypothetical protein